jgi:hypothetical protein
MMQIYQLGDADYWVLLPHLPKNTSQSGGVFHFILRANLVAACSQAMNIH